MNSNFDKINIVVGKISENVLEKFVGYFVKFLKIFVEIMNNI